MNPIKNIDEFPSAHAGIIIIADIVDFSLLKGQEQKNIVIKLWHYFENKDILDTKTERVLNGTGDGILIAFPNLITPQVSYGNVLEFCKDWIKYMKSVEPKIKIRIGLHKGHFERIKLKDIEEIQAIGTGPNNCARIVNIGDGSDIVVSEEFVSAWYEQEKGVLKNFVPSEEDETFELFVKHEIPQRVRIVKHFDNRDVPPKKIGFIQIVREHIINQLKLIEKEFCNVIQKFDNTLNSGSLSVRVSILAPVKGESGRRLCSTHFRYNKNNEATMKGKTKYRILRKASGPPGFCFVKNELTILKNLPDPNRKRKQYIDIFVEKWNMRKKEVENFGRFARAFICIPIGLNKKVADAVICIDTRHPLTNIKTKDLKIITDNIRRDHNISLSSLWKLRINF